MHQLPWFRKPILAVVPLIMVTGYLALPTIFTLDAVAQGTAADITADARAGFVTTQNTNGSNIQTTGVVSGLTATGAVLDGTPFPHVFMYGGPNSAGWPLVGSTAKVGTCGNNPAVACAVNTDCGSADIVCNNTATQNPAIGTPLNSAELDAAARFPLVVFSPTPLSDGRPDIIPALRARNPNIKIFSYTTGHMMWCPGYPGNNSYPDGYYYRDYYLAVNAGDPSCTTTSDRWLWRQDHTQSGYDVNLAHRDLNGNYDVAEAIANTIYEHAKPSRGFDGIFVDVFCPNYLWAEDAGNPWDYTKAGYANQSDFAAGWLAGYQREAEHLRELAITDGHPDYPITGNCAQAPASVLPVLNGWMRENYPYQNGGTFNSNMLTYPWGYLQQDYLFQSPQYNYIFTGGEPSSQPYTTYNQQKMRFGLGSATLGNGYHAFEDPIANMSTDNYPTWWFDEYGVDTTVPQSSVEYGKAKSGAAYSSWLGQPRGEQYAYILPNGNPDVLPFNTFDQNITHISLATNSGAQATIERQTIDTASGAGDLHVHITQVGPTATSILMNSDVYTNIANTYYSLTFWAKADAPRSIAVAIDGAGQDLPITTVWKKYQVTLKTIGNGSAVYQFQLGNAIGDLWFDDIQFQTGVGNVYRRDFDNGIVLVNPFDVPLTVTLEKQYRKILGTVNPTLNDGSVVQVVTLTPNVAKRIGDALFLLNYDATPPAQVTNLQGS